MQIIWHEYLFALSRHIHNDLQRFCEVRAGGITHRDRITRFLILFSGCSARARQPRGCSRCAYPTLLAAPRCR